MNIYMYACTYAYIYIDTYTYTCYSPKLPGDLKRNGVTEKKKRETEVSRERAEGNDNVRYRNI